MKKIVEQLINVYGKGIYNAVEDTVIPDGAASNSSNFITLLDRIELAAGRRILGQQGTGNKGVLGLGRIEKIDGTELILRKIGTSLQYYNLSTLLWVDIKTDLLEDEPMYFTNSFTPAGRQIWCSGQDGLFKIYPSSPLSIIDLTDPDKNYKGVATIDKSRMVIIGMKEDPTGFRISKVDRDSNYTSVTAESVSVSSGSHYTGTLAHGQVFGLVFTKGSQLLRDDKNGNLTGDGTGTINYATGAYVLDFTTSNADVVTADYLWEDPLNGGLADFRYSATRLAGEGNVLRQDSIGTKTQIVKIFNNQYYTLQDRGSWVLNISTDDLTFDNQIYRLNIGCPSHRGAVDTADGIIFVDTYNPELPTLSILRFNQFGDKIIPVPLSDNFKMSDYTFDEETALYKKGVLVFIACKYKSPNNNKFIIYNTLYKCFDVTEYSANMVEELENQIIVGDSQQPTCFELFTGVDDLDYEIVAKWEGKNSDLKTQYLKKYKKLRLTGYIDLEQSYDVYASYDNDPYKRIGTVYGDAVYIDFNKQYTIGEDVLGDEVIGLVDSSRANYYETELKVRTPKFRRCKLKYVPLGVGYMSILEQKFSDIRVKSHKIPKKYKTGSSDGIGSMRVDDAFIVD